MLESFPVILIVGTVLGFLAGIGVGGGSLFLRGGALLGVDDHVVALAVLDDVYGLAVLLAGGKRPDDADRIGLCEGG